MSETMPMGETEADAAAARFREKLAPGDLQDSNAPPVPFLHPPAFVLIFLWRAMSAVFGTC